MRRVLTTSLAGALLALTSTAAAHNTPWAVTVQDVEWIVKTDVTVQLPGAEKAALESELRASIRALMLYRLAHGDGTGFASSSKGAPYAYKRALRKVRDGLDVDRAACAGSGSVRQGRPFKHFRCSVTSETIEIPSAALVPPTVDGEEPELVAGSPQIVGPLLAELEVHATGKSSIQHRRVG